MPKIEERVGSLETKFNLSAGFGTLILLGWLSYLSVTLSRVSEDTAKIRQALKDKGTEIVHNIQSGDDPRVQKAALLTATVDIQKAAKTGRAPDPEKVSALVSALDSATSAPQVPEEAWPAVTSLISYRTQSIQLPRPVTQRCVLENPAEPEAAAGTYGFRRDLNGCIFDLNDIAAVEQLRAFVRAREKGTGASSHLFIHLAASIVRYDPNRPLVSLEEFTCQNCRLEVANPDQTPSGLNQRLLQAILASPATAIKVERTGAANV